jgi:hypothetical protein
MIIACHDPMRPKFFKLFGDPWIQHVPIGVVVLYEFYHLWIFDAVTTAEDTATALSHTLESSIIGIRPDILAGYIQHTVRTGFRQRPGNGTYLIYDLFRI